MTSYLLASNSNRSQLKRPILLVLDSIESRIFFDIDEKFSIEILSRGNNVASVTPLDANQNLQEGIPPYIATLGPVMTTKQNTISNFLVSIKSKIQNHIHTFAPSYGCGITTQRG